MILPIFTYGQSVLREETKLIDESYPDLNVLVSNMFDTMYNADGVGLAAPQVGLALQILVIDADPLGKDYIECAGFKRVMVNPEIIDKSEDTILMEEGCLSFPGVHEKVARSAKIRIQYMDETFQKHEEEIEGFAARVVQHEYDHLHGRVFIDAISPIRRQLNKAKLNNIINGTAKCSYRIKPIKK